MSPALSPSAAHCGAPGQWEVAQHGCAICIHMCNAMLLAHNLSKRGKAHEKMPLHALLRHLCFRAMEEYCSSLLMRISFVIDFPLHRPASGPASGAAVTLRTCGRTLGLAAVFPCQRRSEGSIVRLTAPGRFSGARPNCVRGTFHLISASSSSRPAAFLSHHAVPPTRSPTISSNIQPSSNSIPPNNSSNPDLITD